MKFWAFCRGVAALAMLAATLQAHGADFTFAAFGDTPYTDEEELRFVAMIAEINRARPAFSIHVGDFKSGWSPCTDALFEQRAQWFALFHAPLVYVPGDNEWSDCWRAWGASYDPLERLQKLRALFSTGNVSLGQQKLALTRQNTTYPEHTRWTHDGIVFATLNVPGGRNNMRMPDELAARSKAIDEWVRDTFKFARTQRAPAVVIAFQANPIGGNGKASQYYVSVINTLMAETLNFPGEVLLVHGDTHRYRYDQPLTNPRTNRPIRNFTRLEVFGYPFVNWVNVRVTRHKGKVIFTPSPGGT